MNILGISAAMLLVFTSCEDWLDMPSESKADSSTVFETVELSAFDSEGISSQSSQEVKTNNMAADIPKIFIIFFILIV